MRNPLRSKRSTVALAGALCAATAMGPVVAPTTAAAAPHPAPRVVDATGPVTSLTPPTGHDKIGTVRLHLVDPTRIDPTSPTPGVRELMVQAWYATDTDDFPTAPWLSPLAAADFLAPPGPPPGTVLPTTVGHTGAPVDRRHGPRPVVLYSPGSGADGEANTGLVEELASHGYVVVTIDATNDSPQVEFPGGRLVTNTFQEDTLAKSLEGQQIRADDARFVLDELTVLNRGGNPDAEHATLPRGLAGSLDLNRVGMFGWSRGGAASAQAMHDDPRIKAGVNMDGGFLGPLAQRGVDRPFLLLTGSEHTEATDASLATFLAASTGPKLHLALDNSQHPTFSDFEEIEHQLGLPAQQVQDQLGTIDPKTAVADLRAYLRAFFDKYLRGRDNHLLDGPSRRFPDIQFQP